MALAPSRRSFADVRHLPSYHDVLPELARELGALCADGD
eukprot:gene51-35594_t